MFFYLNYYYIENFIMLGHTIIKRWTVFMGVFTPGKSARSLAFV